MSVGVLLVTHPGIGASLLHSAQRIVDGSPLSVMCLEVPVDASVVRAGGHIEEMLAQLNQGDGVLILTDIFGATPNNIARQFTQTGRVAVLAGLNLPMLVRVFNYPEANLKELCEAAVIGGSRGVHDCRLTEPAHD